MVFKWTPQQSQYDGFFWGGFFFFNWSSIFDYTHCLHSGAQKKTFLFFMQSKKAVPVPMGLVNWGLQGIFTTVSFWLTIIDLRLLDSQWLIFKVTLNQQQQTWHRVCPQDETKRPSGLGMREKTQNSRLDLRLLGHHSNNVWCSTLISLIGGAFFFF